MCEYNSEGKQMDNLLNEHNSNKSVQIIVRILILSTDLLKINSSYSLSDVKEISDFTNSQIRKMLIEIMSYCNVGKSYLENVGNNIFKVRDDDLIKILKNAFAILSNEYPDNHVLLGIIKILWDFKFLVNSVNIFYDTNELKENIYRDVNDIIKNIIENIKYYGHDDCLIKSLCLFKQVKKIYFPPIDGAAARLFL
jgi:hypothetical protein